MNGGNTPPFTTLDLLTELSRRAEKTSYIRFIAARRLSLHHRFSQWVVGMASVALMALPLVELFNVATGFSNAQLNALEILLAVAVLAYSLLLSQENYAVRADRMHACAIEMATLVSHMRHALANGDGPKSFLEFAERYETLLQRSENHAEIDYYWHKLRDGDFDGFRTGLLLFGHVLSHGVASIVHYVLVLLLLAALLIRLLNWVA